MLRDRENEARAQKAVGILLTSGKGLAGLHLVCHPLFGSFLSRPLQLSKHAELRKAMSLRSLARSAVRRSALFLASPPLLIRPVGYCFFRLTFRRGV